jgi:hypothetical protein
MLKKDSGLGSARQCLNDLVQVFTGTYDYLAHRVDKRTATVLAVYVVSWLSWPIWSFYVSSWVGVDVYGGDANAAEGTPGREAYNKGVEVASSALFLYSIVAFVYSLMIPLLIKIKFLGYRSLWAGAMILHGLIYFALVAYRGKYYTVALIAITGINLATMHTVPWVFLSWSTAPSDNGIAAAVVNVCNAVPSLFFNGLINPGLQLIFSSLVPVMCFGGFTMLLSAAMVLLISRPTEEELKKTR